MRTSAKQEKFHLDPPFFVFKHKKLFYSSVTKHTLKIWQDSWLPNPTTYRVITHYLNELKP